MVASGGVSTSSRRIGAEGATDPRPIPWHETEIL
jgi:hypothetical protein